MQQGESSEDHSFPDPTTGASPESNAPPGSDEPASGPGRLEAPRHGDLTHLVGIGSSAGGLEALQLFVGGLRPCGRVAYVVAQHLSPDHPSLLVNLLTRATTLQVITALDGVELRPDTIAIAPPNHDIRVRDHRLQVVDPSPRFGPSPCIDLLFESIAEHWGDRGVAVVLSGTGSDGARGLRTVRAAGGLTIAQAPESARFEGMPSAAIALGGADLILEPAAIGQKLDDLMRSGGDWVGRSLPEPEPVNISSVIHQLKHSTGIDFSQYRASTLRRQMQRRMAIRQVASVDDYLQLLVADANESSALVQNLLVTVTSFFRDPEAFQALGELLRAYVNQQPRREKLRVWVPGCATGEEVYSIGMLISQALDHPVDLASHLKIFGTDLDEESLAVARRATYPVAAAMVIPETLRDRFVIRQNGELVISESLRNCVVFARHNVAEDPPFPRLDLISCRNTLIYFTPPLQERVLSLFRFGLLPAGLLFLGHSELLSSHTSGFGVADAENRIFFRTAERQAPRETSFSFSPQHEPIASQPLGRVSILRETIPEQHVATLEALVRSRCPPCVVLDENHELVEVIGEVRPYCRLPEGRISSAATTFLLPDLQAEARTLLLMVRADGVPIRSRLLHLQDFDVRLRLEARPLRVIDRVLTVLSFLPEDTKGPEEPATIDSSHRDADFDHEIARLENELLNSQDWLRRSMADLEAANEELEASAEELQATSEELQSSNEELESSNEELQATNEELATLNQELRSRSEELQLLSTDLENIQNSLNQGMVIVDRDLRITRYTPLAVRVFALVDSDIGQPLLGIPTTVSLPGLRTALGEVLAGSPRRSIEALSEDVAYMAQVLPYQQREGQRLGAIITLTDVSELVALRRAAEASLAEFSSLTDALDEAVWKRDFSMRKLLYASRRFLPLTGWSPAELLSRPELLEEAINTGDRERLWASRDLRQGSWAVSYRITTREGQERWVLESAQVLEEDLDRYVVGTLSDITDQRRTEEHARDLAHLFETLISSPSFAMTLLDGSRSVVMVNPSLCQLIGFEKDSLLGSPFSLFCDLPEGLLPAAAEGSQTTIAPAVETLTLRHRDGSQMTRSAELWPLPASMTLGSHLIVIPSLGVGTPDG